MLVRRVARPTARWRQGGAGKCPRPLHSPVPSLLSPTSFLPLPPPPHPLPPPACSCYALCCSLKCRLNLDGVGL